MKSISGKGKFENAFIDGLQNYYEIAIRSNSDNMQTMQQNVIAALLYCTSSKKNQCMVSAQLGKKTGVTISELSHVEHQ